MTIHRLPVLLLLITTLACSREESIVSSEPTDEISKSEYEVLAAVVDSMILGRSDKLLVVEDSTSWGSFMEGDSALTAMMERIGEHLLSLRPETVLDFKSKNATRTYVENPKSIDERCVHSGTSAAVFPRMDVSRVGFSSDGQQALVYVGCVSAPLAGAGAYYLLSRQHGAWVITASTMVWIS